jgi:signal transduction histidine kinase
VLESRDFRLSDMIDSLVSVIGDSLGAKGVAFQVVMEDMPEFLRGDDTRLSQALLNYLSNAAKFTDAGSVSLSGRVEARNASGFVLHFQVVDSTGIGISSAHLPHLFQPFEQAEGSTTRRFGGTGLGLSVTRKIVEAMGGEVGAESVPGRGAGSG